MENIFIPILLGSAREGRISEKAAKFVLSEAKEYGKFETDLIDVRDYVFSGKTEAMPEEKAHQWSKIMERADGLIVVSPEYNHSYPGELKLMLDQLYEEYHRKPIGVCGVSKSGLGGARMTEILRITAIELHMVPIRNAVYFSNAPKLFGENGKILDESYGIKLKKFFDEMLWYAVTLKRGREK